MQNAKFRIRTAMNGKLIIFSAPSGSGKTTIVRELLKHYTQFEFSISATSRAPRGVEQNGTGTVLLCGRLEPAPGRFGRSGLQAERCTD